MIAETICNRQRGTHLATGHFPVALAEQLQPSRVERSHRLGQVPEYSGVVEVQCCAGVVGKDPREDGPLGEVVEGAAGCKVAEEQVVPVADLARLPRPRHPL